MIKNIKIDEFGRFNNFDNNEIEFKKLNLFYGWNYSGKTTLSRIFALFDEKHNFDKIIEDYSSTTFKFILDDNSTINIENRGNISTKVFNSDYVKSNLKFDVCHTEPVFILGEDTIEKQEELDKLIKKLNSPDKKRTVLSVISNFNTSIASKEKHLNNEHTKTASLIKATLDMTEAFTKSHLEAELNQINTNDLGEILSLDEDLRLALEREYKITDTTQIIPEVVLPTFHNMEEIKEVLKNVIMPSESLEYLLNAPAVENWTYSGKELHEGSKICLFCRQEIPTDLMDKLNKPFNKEFSEFKRGLEDFKNSLKPLDIKIPHKSEFSQKFLIEYESLIERYNNWITSYKVSFSRLIQIFNEKNENITTPINELNIDFNFIEIEDVIKQINDLRTQHNDYKQNLSKHKSELRSKLIKYYIAKMLTDKDYVLYKNQIPRYKAIVTELETEKEHLISKIDELKAEISNLHKGAETVNKYLNYFFGETGKIKIVIDNNKTKIYRDEDEAKNLSEGEKTAIAISHFLTSLEALSEEEKKSAILYIDDPISSLDSNHIYAVYSKLVNLKDAYNQVFIATHNYEFYKLCSSDANKKYYIVRKPSKSTIEKIPKVYETFKSEYTYLFYILWTFTQNPNPDDLYRISNVARRFTEMFAGFKVPSDIGIHGKLETLLEDKDRAIKIMKCFHNGSHNQFSNGFKDLSTAQESIIEILEMVKTKDEDHYNCLVDVANRASSSN